MKEPSQAAELHLLGGALALDFANTAGGRASSTPIENLRLPTDLLAWSQHAGILAGGKAARLRVAIQRDPRLGVHLLNAAHDLRDAIFEIGSALASDHAPADADLSLLKDFYGRAVIAGALAPINGAAYAFDFSGAPPEHALFGPIAASALAILTSLDKTRLKQCPAEDCGWLFIDSSKNRSRRWCDMATCGNRMKARVHRSRQE